MNIEKIFNITKKDIEAKKLNIFVPICVGNKFFLDGVTPTETISNYINWALQHTKEKIIILIVDKIQITNWIIRNSKISYEQNMRRLMRKGLQIKEKFQELLKKLPKEEQKKIEIIRWEDYCENDTFCNKTTKIIYKEFKNNKEFRKNVLESVKASITDRTFDEESYVTLCNYVLDEFSLVYHGAELKGIHYNLYVYPYTDEVLEFIEKIKKGQQFPELSKKLNNKKTAVILLN